MGRFALGKGAAFIAERQHRSNVNPANLVDDGLKVTHVNQDVGIDWNIVVLLQDLGQFFSIAVSIGRVQLRRRLVRVVRQVDLLVSFEADQSRLLGLWIQDRDHDRVGPALVSSPQSPGVCPHQKDCDRLGAADDGILAPIFSTADPARLVS